MKKILIAAAFAAISSAPAMAADMAVKAAPIARPCAADQWKGFYIGGNVGAAYQRADRNDINFWLSGPGGQHTQSDVDVAVGGQAGYNWGSCNVVFGVEVDGMWSNLDKFWLSAPVAGAAPLPAQFELGGLTTKLDGIVTLRGRTGIAIDSTLFYITGGAAALHTRTVYSHIHSDNSFIGTNTVDDWRWGWVAGFGAEWAWTRNWSLKSEFLYVGTVSKDYRTLSVVNAPNTASFNNFTESDSVFISRVGVNYRF